MPRKKRSDAPEKVETGSQPIVGAVILCNEDGSLVYGYYTSPSMQYAKPQEYIQRAFGESKGEFQKRVLGIFQARCNE